MSSSEKLAILNDILDGYGKVAVAFSGGVDSSFLLAAAVKKLGSKNVLAITVASDLSPRFELQNAQWFCEDVGAEQMVVDADPLADEDVRNNHEDRCYHCKLGIFSVAMVTADVKGFDILADGTNADDASDYRPGERALAELGVVSPLREAGLTKHDIRELSREMGLTTWDDPSCACLATRIPYGTALDAETLKRIDEAEDYLRKLDFEEVRVRAHGDIARIEVGRTQIARLAEPATRMDVTAVLKGMGFKYICLDLEGFRTGSMNEAIERGKHA